MREIDRMKKKIGFPMFAHYNLPVKYFIEQGLGQTYVKQPKMTARTMELGAKYAPDMVCPPYKEVLGSLMEALEAGADTLIMPMGLCRLGYYGELAEQTLHDLGYQFDMINLAEYTTGKSKDYFKAIKRVSPKINALKAGKAGLDAMKMCEDIDEIEALYYESCGFELEKGAYRRAFLQFQHAMSTAETRDEIDAGYETCKTAFQTIPVDKGEFPLRVGMIGEYFTVMDSFSNLDLEKTLADMGVEVHRWMNISHRNLHYPGEKNLNVRIHDLCTYEMGPTSTANIWAARCTVFAESDLVHKIQVGHTKEDIVAGLCQAVVGNYLNNVGKGKKIYSPVVFQGGVSKNIGVVKAFEKQLGCPVIVDENGHLMGAIGAAILARRNEKRASFDFSMEDMDFVTREVNCGRCPNNCEIICVYRNGELIDSWGNRCERGEISVNAVKTLKERHSSK
jgi:glutaredoxin